MKRLDELGVSPAPWRAETGQDPDTHYELEVILSANGRFVANCSWDVRRGEADARLVAAAPDLYEALRVSMGQMCEYCRKEAAHTMPGVPCDNGCAAMLAAKRALEKAGGEA